MSNWKDKYKDKIVSAEKAVAAVKSGDQVVVGHAAGAPEALITAMVARTDLKDVKVFQMVVMGSAAYSKPEVAKSFYYNGAFVGGSTPLVREAVEKGRGDMTPCFFFEVPRLFKDKILPADVALIQVTPPDENGFCSYGLSGDYTVAAAENAPIVIAQVNANYPRTGGSKIHLDAITYIVEKDEPLLELNPPKIGDVERKIGEYVASLIPNGATLQLGIGAIPDAVLLFLNDKKDLGIHSEMFSDGVVHLAQNGVITNTKKTLHPNKFIASFLMGSRKLYDFVNNNPNVEVLPVDYVNDPFVIGQIDNMISINSALQVDLLGQVNAEMIGKRQFSGIGGQVDFVRGASRSKGGKAIIAMPSTAAKGKISRICAELDRGACVTTSRTDVHYVVTEYGIAELRGKTIRQRIDALISIAHPDFRDSLRAASGTCEKELVAG